MARMHAGCAAPGQGFEAAMPVAVTVCTTCKYAAGTAFDAQGRTGGEVLAAALEAAAGNQTAAPRIIRHECLWACRDSCAVLIQSAGKTGYLAGGFEAGTAAAEAILDWSAAYAERSDGVVPYAQWPDGMKGHFIARIPAGGETGS
jgi:predicted metal-binding protein